MGQAFSRSGSGPHPPLWSLFFTCTQISGSVSHEPAPDEQGHLDITNKKKKQYNSTEFIYFLGGVGWGRHTPRVPLCVCPCSGQDLSLTLF